MEERKMKPRIDTNKHKCKDCICYSKCDFPEKKKGGPCSGFIKKQGKSGRVEKNEAGQIVIKKKPRNFDKHLAESEKMYKDSMKKLFKASKHFNMHNKLFRKWFEYVRKHKLPPIYYHEWAEKDKK